jgi:hypothetical protein
MELCNNPISQSQNSEMVTNFDIQWIEIKRTNNSQQKRGSIFNSFFFSLEGWTTDNLQRE